VPEAVDSNVCDADSLRSADAVEEADIGPTVVVKEGVQCNDWEPVSGAEPVKDIDMESREKDIVGSSDCVTDAVDSNVCDADSLRSADAVADADIGPTVVVREGVQCNDWEPVSGAEPVMTEAVDSNVYDADSLRSADAVADADIGPTVAVREGVQCNDWEPVSGAEPVKDIDMESREKDIVGSADCVTDAVHSNVRDADSLRSADAVADADIGPTVVVREGVQCNDWEPVSGAEPVKDIESREKDIVGSADCVRDGVRSKVNELDSLRAADAVNVLEGRS
jgi:hypothetical protein